MLQRITLYLSMVKFSHSVFALPFALTSAQLAAGGIPTLKQTLLIVIAMVSARSGAMGLNRIIDKEIDAQNPRTANRELPKGLIKTTEAVVFVIISFSILVISAYLLNDLCFKLSPVAIAFLILYSYTKRFTWLCHIVLGICISAAPLGAWIAIRGTFDMVIVPMALAVVFWLAGFDVLYALQDIEFDRRVGLKSIPARFGIKRSIMLSRLMHTTTFGLLVTNGILFNLSLAYWIGMVVVGLLLIYEHSLVKADDLSKLDFAFFNMNGYISLVVFVATSMALLL
jgi:4-hydroxybenzoate polyprenyltransferase